MCSDMIGKTNIDLQCKGECMEGKRTRKYCSKLLGFDRRTCNNISDEEECKQSLSEGSPTTTPCKWIPSKGDN